ncbi:NAD(P)H-binding protein [Lacisediminihabitans changchengi]|uniref:NAD(P)H-binding protein n=1 Tax=Lacisediminihabitans changchengi TaxID=2787634 RepID=A0A934STL7_9MICO|nr:NAD(P)H-binding protein [Lacisediminihabitans changchengi]MBK4348758.1 NAD(P)H-binding protein [Lacisediminihabitans changchengi]
MRIVIAGGHGTIALLLSRRLADAGHQPVGIIRNPNQAADLARAGSDVIELDLENSPVTDVAAALVGADAAVFAAGAGPGSGDARKLSLDRDGAILFANAAVAAGVRRLVVVSSIGAATGTDVPDGDMAVYLLAKGEADAAVQQLDLDWTIVRPVSLTNDSPTGLVTVGATVEHGSIPRADVAAVLAAVVTDGLAPRTVFEVTGGGVPVDEALSAL